MPSIIIGCIKIKIIMNYIHDEYEVLNQLYTCTSYFFPHIFCASVLSWKSPFHNVTYPPAILFLWGQGLQVTKNNTLKTPNFKNASELKIEYQIIEKKFMALFIKI